MSIYKCEHCGTENHVYDSTRDLLKLKNQEISCLEEMLNRVAAKVSGGRWDLIDESIDTLLNEREKNG